MALPLALQEVELSTLSSTQPPPTLLDFLSSVPPPVTAVLIELRPAIAFLKWFAQSASWKGAAEQSWLLLFSWWAFCLLLPSFVKFTIVPAIVAGPVLVKYLPSHSKPKKALTTEQVIAQALTDLDVIHTLIPHLKIEEGFPKEFTWNERRRLFAFLTVPYLTITYIVPVPVLIASFGTFFLTWRSPWCRTTRRVIMRSAHVRALYRQAVVFISGSYSVPLTFSKFKAGPAKVEPELEKRVKHHRFLFTVLENQRWWVGIDWTAALLPSERPSWSAPATATALAQAAAGNHTQNQAMHPPLPPPSSFMLPSSTSVILPSPIGTGYVKRRAKWQWEDGSEWEVVVHKEGEPAPKRFRPPSIPKSSQTGGTGAISPEPEEGRGSRFLKGHLSKLNIGGVTSQTSLSSPAPPAEPGVVDGDGEKAKTMSEDDENLVTDPEGWIYGDNKWENLSGKNAMGKYTRFRRWCRVAVLVEEETPWDELTEGDAQQTPKYYQLEDGPKQVQSVGPNVDSPPHSAPQQLPVARVANEGPRQARSLSIESRSTASASPERSVKDAKEKDSTKDTEGDHSSLRKRLTAVMKNAAT